MLRPKGAGHLRVCIHFFSMVSLLFKARLLDGCAEMNSKIYVLSDPRSHYGLVDQNV